MSMLHLFYLIYEQIAELVYPLIVKLGEQEKPSIFGKTHPFEIVKGLHIDVVLNYVLHSSSKPCIFITIE